MNNSSKKNATALFGGSFNPPTLAHLSVIKGLSERFEKVIVMPTKISPFKIGAEKICDDDRLSLLRECCKPMQHVEVSDFELKKEGVSYTCFTVDELKKTHENLFLVMGTDNIEGLRGWKNIDKILDKCIVYLVPRPGFPITESDKKELLTLNCRYETADFIGADGSSTLVPVANAFGKLREVVPEKVAEYIESKKLYKQYFFVRDLYEKYNVKKSRVEHTYGVVKAAIILAGIYGADVKKAILASLLHDCGKYVTVRELEQKGFCFDDEAKSALPPVEHCYTSEAIARCDLKINDEEVLRAIRLHTTGDENMSTLEKIVFCADYIEEGRTTPGVEQIRKKILFDLDGAMLAILGATINYLKSKNAEIDKRTLACRDRLEKNDKKGELKC